MQHAVREVAVIGEQEQTFGVVVEAPDGEEPRAFRWQEVDHDRPTLGIGAAADIAARLVQEDVGPRLRAAQELAVEGDPVGLGIGLGARLAPDLAVDGNASGREERFSSPA